jgi:vitamin B12 transporter
VERIEILKGSQSTLYGSDAIAGVINIITKKGGGKPVSVSGCKSDGSYNTQRLQAGINGRLKRVDYNIGYNRFTTDGISEAKPPAETATAYDNDGFNQQGAQASIGIQASEKLRIAPYIRYSKMKGDLDQQAFVDEKDFSYETKNLQAGVRNELLFGATRLNLLYNYNNIDRITGTIQPKAATGFTCSTNRPTKRRSILQKPMSCIRWQADAYGRVPTSAVHVPTLRRLPYRSFDPASPYPVKSTAAQAGDSVQQNQVGVYGALNYGSSGFNAEAGGRYNHHSTYGSNAAFNIRSVVPESKTAGRCLLIFLGYKTPSLYQLYSNTEIRRNRKHGHQYGMRAAVFSGRRKRKRTCHLFLPRCKRCNLLFLQPCYLSVAIH